MLQVLWPIGNQRILRGWPSATNFIAKIYWQKQQIFVSKTMPQNEHRLPRMPMGCPLASVGEQPTQP